MVLCDNCADGTVGLRRAAKESYLARLRIDSAELDLLAKGLLIHVTSFFRDPAAYDSLAKQADPGLQQPDDLSRARCASQAVSLFHFALKTGGVYKGARLYRHVGRIRPGDLSFAATAADNPRAGRLGRQLV